MSESSGATSKLDPLAARRRAALFDAPRPHRKLPVMAAESAPIVRRLPLAEHSRPIDRAARPVFAVWELTLACDLACRHCGSRAGEPREHELSTAEALDLVAQMRDLGVREVALIGGEAYLHDGWTEIVTEIRRCGMQSTLVTGGRGMTAERAKQAANAGVQSVAVSIDGIEATHDRLRGLQGSHAAAVNALRNCRDAGLQIAMNTQVNRLNLTELHAVCDLLLAVSAHGWQVQLTVPAGRAADEPEVLLQPYDLLALFPLLAEVKHRCDAAGVKMMPGNNVGYFGPFEHVLRSYSRCGHGGSCDAGRGTLGIESSGDIKGCPSLPTDGWVGGNIREHSLRDVWERSSALRHMRDRTTDELWGYCRDCYYADLCKGGCTWMTTTLFEKPGNNPYCHHRALDLEKQGKRERVIRTAEAPGRSFDRAEWALVLEDTKADVLEDPHTAARGTP